MSAPDEGKEKENHKEPQTMSQYQKRQKRKEARSRIKHVRTTCSGQALRQRMILLNYGLSLLY